jgi:tetratricopeptide (TPR) repeat protein
MQAEKKKKTTGSRRIDLQELLEEGERHYIDHEWKAALLKFNRILDLSPDHAKAFARVREIYALEGDIGRLSDHLARGARYLISLKKYNDAVSILENLLRIKPDNYLARLMISEIVREEGKWDEAFSSFVNWGRLFKKKKMPEEALLFLQNAYEMMPQNLEIAGEIAEVMLEIRDPRYASQFYRNLSIECLKKKLITDARTTLKTFLALKDSTHDRTTIDTVYFKAGVFTEQELPLCGLLSIDFDETKALKKLGYTLGSKHRFGEAIKVYEELLRMHPDDVESTLRLGDLYIMIQVVDEGVAYLLRAAGDYLAAGEREKARRLYERITGIEPSCEEARSRLEEMGEE